MSKKTSWILGIIFVVVTFILHYVLETVVGGFIMTISFLALIVAIVGAIYYLIKFSIKQFYYNRKNRNNNG